MTEQSEVLNLYKVTVDFHWETEVEAQSHKEAMDQAWEYELRSNVEDYVSELLVSHRIKQLFPIPEEDKKLKES